MNCLWISILYLTRRLILQTARPGNIQNVHEVLNSLKI